MSVDPNMPGSTLYPEPVAEPATNIDSSIEGMEAWEHVNGTSTVFDINSVADQLSNDTQRPEFEVTVEQLMEGGPSDYAFGTKLDDSRDHESDPTPTPTPTPTPSPDSSTLPYNPSDPDSWAYDENKDGTPDIMQWKAI